MFKTRVSSFLKKGITLAGLLSWWEDHITHWPRVIFYHYVGNDAPFFLADMAVPTDVFLEQISALRSRYRFLTWEEYKQALASPNGATRCLLLTFDDGFASTWSTMSTLAREQEIPSVFFLNTRVLDNAYAPWPIQYYFLRGQANGKFLEPLWKSISSGQVLSAVATRSRCHECFSLESVVTPIEEGLANFGLTPAELAEQYRLYVGGGDVRNRNPLIDIGNHSHSHYILSRLSDSELNDDLQTSHKLLVEVLGGQPDCFAYPFGIPGEHCNERCLRTLRSIGPYPFIFSGQDTVGRPSNFNDIGRICLDAVGTTDVVATAAKVTPRALKTWLIGNSRTSKVA
jgi:peptidoglycan/xylan/chitin deacetylase (PgdA/CDA1 family)